VSKIQAYDFDIEFMKGKNNVVADALSRIPSVYSLSNIYVDWKSQLLVEYSKNKFACELMDGQVQDERFQVRDDLIYYKERIFLVPGSKFKGKILREYHDSPLARYEGFLKTYRKIRERFTWKGLKEDVMHHVSETKMNTPTQQVYCSHFPFQNTNGKVYLWISLQDCPRYKVRMEFLWWWIV
jgi:hypothetical protein